MDIVDYGITKILPYLSKEKVKAVEIKLKGLGVYDINDAQSFVKEDELTDENLLKPVEARKLFKFWNSGDVSLVRGYVVA